MKKIITIIVCILLVAVVIAVGFIATRPQKNDTAIKTLKDQYFMHHNMWQLLMDSSKKKA